MTKLKLTDTTQLVALITELRAKNVCFIAIKVGVSEWDISF